MVPLLWKTAWRFLKKLNIELSLDSSNPNSGHISRENHNSKSYVHPMFIAALFAIARISK